MRTKPSLSNLAMLEIKVQLLLTGLVGLATYLCPCLSGVSLENVAIHYKSLETSSLYSEFDHDGGLLSACKRWPLLNSSAKGCLLSISVKLEFRNIEERQIDTTYVTSHSNCINLYSSRLNDHLV